MTDKEFFGQEFGGVDILDTSRKGMTVYAAFRSKRKGDVFGMVILIRYHRSDPLYNFCYKDMSEDMGPYEHDCPERILDLLSPTTNESSLRWREACRKRQSKKISVRTGDIIETAQPIIFSRGSKVQRFRIVNARRLLAVHADAPVWARAAYKLRRDHLLGATVIGHAA